jgi:N-acyl homoserine lactone hydrolase
MWKIKPILCGTLEIDKSAFLHGRNQGQIIQAPSYSWYLKGPEGKILVDTGYGDPELMSRLHRPCRKSEEQKIENALKALGTSPEEIDIVVLTHLHWDHCGDLGLFKNATLIVRREELSYAIAPLGEDAVRYDSPTIGRIPSWLDKKFEFIKGDKEIISGIDLIFTPGHTPGHQSVSVETEKGTYVIAGDAIPLHDNLIGTKDVKFISTGLYFDYQWWWESAEKILEIAGKKERILPGHDIEVIKKSEYP